MLLVLHWHLQFGLRGPPAALQHDRAAVNSRGVHGWANGSAAPAAHAASSNWAATTITITITNRLTTRAGGSVRRVGARGARDAAGTSARTRASVQTALRAPAWPATTGALLFAGAAAAALVYQRWTMLLLLMLAFAELFVPGLLLLQLRKAWVVTVSSTYHRHTVCTHAVCTCTGTYPCGMYMCRHTHVPPIGKQVIR